MEDWKSAVAESEAKIPIYVVPSPSSDLPTKLGGIGIGGIETFISLPRPEYIGAGPERFFRNYFLISQHD